MKHFSWKLSPFNDNYEAGCEGGSIGRIIVAAAGIMICGQTSEGQPLRGAASLEGLANNLESLAAGMTEPGCHPGCTEEMNSPYCQEQEIEVRMLCDPEIRTILRELKIEMQTLAGVRGWA